MKRELRKILTNKWMLYIYIIFTVTLIICYIRCMQSNYTKLSSNTQLSPKLNRGLSNEGKKQTLRECFLFLLIITAPKAFIQRKAMRETWLSRQRVDHLKINHVFFIGTMNLDLITLKELREEQSTYSDIIFLTDHEESYTSLTSKLLKSLLWINNNVNTKFVMKVDDDSFVRIDMLVRDLNRRNIFDRLYWGYFRGNANIKRTGSWSERNWFLSDHYLPYALGGGYIISFDLVNYISKIPEMLQLYNSEDASLGVWLAPVQMNRIHDIRFDTEYRSRGCSNTHVVSHKQRPEDMYEKYEQLIHHNRLCKKEKEILFTFDYNWKVPTSQCCKRVKRSMLNLTLY